MKEKMQENPTSEIAAAKGVSRRKFLTFAGGLAGATVLLDACKNKDDNNVDVTPSGNTVDLGSGDAGLMNYAFLLQQLQADFYTKLMANRYDNMIEREYWFFHDIKDHEIAQREFLKNMLDAKAISNQEFDFSMVDFSSRENVLQAAMSIEENIVAAFNGIAMLFITPDILTYMAKMQSVQARHAAVIRNQVKNGSFAETANDTGMDKGVSPAETLYNFKAYLKTNFSTSNLPTQ